jgi:peptidoglycan/LPS O-acetylase OafA/YrhL
MPLDIKPLTALRFAAAIWVVSFHYWPSLTSDVPMLVQKGYLGVEMFFVLSGFILAHVYLQGFGEGRFNYRDFIWRGSRGSTRCTWSP